MSKSTVESEVGYELKRVQHALRLSMDRGLRKDGLTTPQYATLSALAAEPGLSGAELARRSFVTPQTMNVIVTKLNEAGLIERRRHPVHGRVLQTYLTEVGAELTVQADEIADGISRRMLSGLEQDERLRLLDILRSCADALGDGERQPVSGH
ncbi:MAG: MarR family winged helix-turn-helix transcriptional regulator [Rubrobacteraceae bacterium]